MLPNGQPLQLAGCLHAVHNATTAVVGKRLHFDVRGPAAIVPLHMINHVKPGELLVWVWCGVRVYICHLCMPLISLLPLFQKKATEAALHAMRGPSSSWVCQRTIPICNTNYQAWSYKTARIAAKPVSEAITPPVDSTSHAAHAIKALQQGVQDEHSGISLITLSFATRAINHRYERWLAEHAQNLDVLILCLRLLSLIAMLRVRSILWLRGIVVVSPTISIPVMAWLPLVCCKLCVLVPAMMTSSWYHGNRAWLLPLGCVCMAVCNAYYLVPWLLEAAAPDSPVMVLHLLTHVSGLETALGNALLTVCFCVWNNNMLDDGEQFSTCILTHCTQNNMCYNMPFP